MAAFNLLSATSVDFQTVDLVFSNPVLPDNPANTSIVSFSFDRGLYAIAAVVQSSNTIRVYTNTQSSGTVYTVKVINAAVVDSTSGPLIVNVAQFAGQGVPPKYLVQNLDSQSVCSGQAVSLSWTNPTTPSSPLNVQIVRRLKAWPFDLTDSHDVVYNGSPITSFTDTGIAVPITSVTAPVSAGVSSIAVASVTGYSIGDSLRIEKTSGPVTFDLVTISSFSGLSINFSPPLANAYATGDRVAHSIPLLPQTYYYYLVLVSTSATPTSYDIDDASRTFSLSISSSLNSYQWLVNETPQYYMEQDAIPQAQKGGGGFLSQWFQVMGCWLNLMRGQFNAISLLGDVNNAPFHVLAAKNQSLGIDPEGLSYDFDIVRRPLTSLVFVYKRKGTCPGIVETVRMFTKWDATCIDFAAGSCREGATTLKTWDGSSLVHYGQGPVPSQISEQIIVNDGSGEITDTSASLVVNLYEQGTIRGWIGDIVCVSSNTATNIFTTAPDPTSTTTTLVSSGSVVVPVANTSSFYPGMTVQITSTSGVAPFPAEVVQINFITPGIPGSLHLAGPGLRNSYPSGSIVSIGKSILRSEYLGTTSSTALGQVVTDLAATWVQNQWVGYHLLDSSNVKHNVVSNTGNTVTVDGAAPSPGAYSIAFDFNVGGSFAARTPILKYKLGTGVHSTLFEPSYDIEERGTLYDPYNRLYNGPGPSLSGVFGPGDVGVYILGHVPLTVGKAQASGGAIFALDPTQPPPTINQWVGNYLNPNENQTQMFEILANTTSQLTVAGDISSLVTPGQYYYVLTPRDKARFQRVTDRLQKEFSDTDVRIHILFV